VFQTVHDSTHGGTRCSNAVQRFVHVHDHVVGRIHGEQIGRSAVAGNGASDVAVFTKVSQVNGDELVGSRAHLEVQASNVFGVDGLGFKAKRGEVGVGRIGCGCTGSSVSLCTWLGFEAKTINAKGIGRLNFQVGPAANQLISIDLADFGKNGDITGPITSDRAPTNLLTVNSANEVIMNVNKSLDRIAATRATMGAVMNRLEHVIDNLTNVVMNSEASRSQIEDADYAQASTELARTQIMQQAATAVLAQANTSQQTVLKLLQG